MIIMIIIMFTIILSMIIRRKAGERTILGPQDDPLAYRWSAKPEEFAGHTTYMLGFR